MYEEPGEEKGIFRRVADKLNPFSSSDDGKEAPTPESPTELAAKKNTTAKEDSPGVLGSLWNGINPFGGQKPQPVKAEATAKNDQLVNQIDGSLKQKGIDSTTQTASLQTTPEAVSKVAEAKPPPQTMDTGKLLGDIDTNLKKSGKSVEELPAPPEAHAAFNDPAVAEAAVAAAKTKTNPEPQQDVASSGLLSSIDQKLKSQGLEPSKFEAPPYGNSDTPTGTRKESRAGTQGGRRERAAIPIPDGNSSSRKNAFHWSSGQARKTGRFLRKATSPRRPRISANSSQRAGSAATGSKNRRTEAASTRA